VKFYSFEFDEEKINSLRDKNYNDLLILIFSGILNKAFLLEKIKYLKTLFPDAKIIGSTTDGEIVNSHIQKNSFTVSFLFFEKSTVNIDYLTKDKLDEFEDFTSKLITPDSKLIMLFGSGFDIEFESYLKKIKNIPLIGGVAGDNSKFRKNYVIANENIIFEGFVGCSIQGDIEINIRSLFLWEPIGKELTVTKADKNILYELDGEEAFNVYNRYLGVNKKNFLKYSIQFPLINENNVAKAALGLKNNGIVYGGNFHENEKVKFGIVNIVSAVKYIDKELQELNDLKKEALIIVSCVANKDAFPEIVKRKLSMVKNIPNIGFFSYGEFFNKNFLNQTFNYVTLSEGGDIKANIKPSNLEFDSATYGLINLVNYAFREMEEIFYKDNVTGFGNKFAFERDLLKAKEASMFDIKRFAFINNRYGEKTGDLVLKKFAEFLHKNLTGRARIYRISGDYFFVLCFEEGKLKAFTKKIVEYFKEHPIELNEDLKLDIEVVGAFVKRTDDFYSFKIKADLALHYAKSNNLNFVEYSKDLNLEEKIEKEIKTISFVKNALKEDKVIPVFQKIEKKVPSFEALVRIEDGGKLISPFFFLESIKYTSYYEEITKTMILKTFEKFKNNNYKVSLNFSFSDIKNKKIIDFLISNIDKYKMRHRVIIELLESESMNDINHVCEFISLVKPYGIEIAIDDFGSGYSNFVYLTRLSPDYIKIDGSLIKDLDTNDKLKTIVCSINTFAHSLGIQTVAEFVKNKEIYDICKKIGIDGLQGYYIHEPSKEIDEFL